MPDNFMSKLTETLNAPAQQTAQSGIVGALLNTMAQPRRVTQNETNESRRQRLRREYAQLRSAQGLTPAQERRRQQVEKALIEYGDIQPRQEFRNPNAVTSQNLNPQNSVPERMNFADRAMTPVPGTTSYGTEVARRFAENAGLSPEDRQLMDSALFMRRRVPMQGGGTMRIRPTTGQDVLRQSTLDPKDVQEVLQMMATAQGREALAKERDYFRSQREQGTVARQAHDAAVKEGDVSEAQLIAGNMTQALIEGEPIKGMDPRLRASLSALPGGAGLAAYDSETARDIRAGGFQTYASIIDAGAIGDIPGARQLADQIGQGVKEGQNLGDNPALYREIATGFGNLAATLVPGLGAAGLAGRVAQVAPRVARLIALTANAGLSGAQIAGSDYRGMIDSGMDPAQAKQRAVGSGIVGAAIEGIADRFGIFGEGGNALTRAVRGFFFEGGEESAQTITSSLFSDKPVDWNEVLKAGLVGGIVGSPVNVASGVVQGRQVAPTERTEPNTPVSQESPATMPSREQMAVVNQDQGSLPNYPRTNPQQPTNPVQPVTDNVTAPVTQPASVPTQTAQRPITDATGDQFTETYVSKNNIGILPGMQHKIFGMTDAKNQVSDEFVGARRVYDRGTAGPLTVWQRNDGSVYVVNGHHRRAIALNDPKVDELPVRLYKESEGYTFERMKVKGAIQNLLDGKGTPIDYVEVLRSEDFTEDDLANMGADVHSGMVRDARGLMSLPPDLYKQVYNGEIPQDVAAEFGQANLSPTTLKALFNQAIDKEVKERTLARGMADVASRLGTVRKGGEGSLQPVMFEETIEDEIPFVEVATITRKVQKELLKNKRSLQRVMRGTAVGDTSVDKDAQKGAAIVAEQAVRILRTSKEATRLLEEGAVALAKSGDNRVLNDYAKRIIQTLESESEARVRSQGIPVPQRTQDRDAAKGQRNELPRQAQEATQKLEPKSGETVYRYATKSRPPGPGAVPRDGMLGVVPGGKWGVVEYSRELTGAEVRDYELIFTGTRTAAKELAAATKEELDALTVRRLNEVADLPEGISYAFVSGSDRVIDVALAKRLKAAGANIGSLTGMQGAALRTPESFVERFGSGNFADKQYAYALNNGQATPVLFDQESNTAILYELSVREGKAQKDAKEIAEQNAERERESAKTERALYDRIQNSEITPAEWERNYKSTHGKASDLVRTVSERIAKEPKPEPKAVEKVTEKPVTEREAVKEAKPAEKITDVGEKIGGARKDLAERREEGRKERKKAEGRYRILEPDSKNDKYTLVDAKTGKILSEFTTREKAELGVKLAIFAERHGFKATFGENREFFIYRRIGQRLLKLKGGFATKEDAQRYAVENIDEILGTKTTYGESDLVTSPKTARTGPKRRAGNATAQTLKDTFGLRGVEFGNWNNQAERQASVNDAFDALADLAAMMNVDPKVIGLNGNLSLAFGARGHGLANARAHFEPKRVVINLTKEKGFGALAHEWFHAFDQYLLKTASGGYKWEDGEVAGVRRGQAMYATEAASIPALPKDVAEALKGFRDAIRYKIEDDPEAKARAEKSVETFIRELDGRADAVEQAILRPTSYSERKGGSKLTDADRARVKEILSIIKRGDALAEWRPFGSGMKHVWTNDLIEELSALSKKATNRTNIYADNGGFLGYLGSAIRTLDVARERARTTKADATKQVSSEYVKNARALDQARSDTYWSEYRELAARAFQAYVADKSGESNAYLDYGSRNEFYKLNYLPHVDDQMRPYPEGAERRRIVEAADKLVQAFAAQNPRLSPDILASAKKKNTITVDGKERSRLNSEGRPIHPTEEGIKNFWKWFGDSEVVDGQGRPLVVYHGTASSDVFSKFRHDGVGIFFTTDPDLAAQYAEARYDDVDESAGGRIYPAYIRMPNPLIVDAKGARWSQVPVPDSIGSIEGDRVVDTVTLLRAAAIRDYDGVIFTNIIDSPGGDGAARDVYTPYWPRQIKSATGNLGTFSPLNPSILASAKKAGKTPQGSPAYDVVIDPIKTDELIRIDEIIQGIEKAFGKIVYGTAPNGTLGAYLTQSDVAYTRRRNDTFTAAHESAHRLDMNKGLTASMPSSVLAELQSGFFDGSINEDTNPLAHDFERFAKFFEWYLANPTVAKSMAPKAVAWLETALEPKTLAAVKTISDQIRKSAGMTAINKGASTFANPNRRPANRIGEALAVKSKAEMWRKLARIFTDSYAPVIGLARDNKQNAASSEDPEVLLRRLPYLDSMFANGIVDGFIDFKKSKEQGKIVKSRSLRELVEILDDWNTDYPMLESFMNARRHLDRVQRLKTRAQNAITEKEASLNAEEQRLNDLYSIRAENEIVKAMAAYSGRNRNAYEAKLRDEWKQKADEFAKKLKTRQKRNLTIFKKRVVADAIWRGENSGLVQTIDKNESNNKVAAEILTEVKQSGRQSTMEKAAELIADLGDWQLNQLVWSGKLSEDQALSIKVGNPYWFAVKRLQSETDAAFFQRVRTLTGVKNTINEFQGDTSTKESLIASLVERMYQNFAESNRNAVMRTLTGLLGEGQQGVMYKVPTKEGVKEDSMVKVYRDGEEEFWVIDDPLLRKTMQEVTGKLPSEHQWMLNVAKMPTAILQSTVVNAIPFAARNIVRDTVTRSINSPNSGNPLNTLKKKSENVNDNYEALGIGGRQEVFGDPNVWANAQAKAIKHLTGKDTIIVKAWGGYTNALEVAERANRKAEFDAAYKNAKKQGMNDFDASLFAAHQARENMTDFRQAGTAVKILNHVVPFLSAQIAGQRTEARLAFSSKKNIARWSARMMLYALMGVGIERWLAEFFGYSKDLDNLGLYQRDLFWNFKIGDYWLAIPKGHSQGAFIGMAEHGIRAAYDKSPKEFDGVMNQAGKTILPLGSEDFLGSWTTYGELMFNKNLYLGKDIIPFYERDIPIEARKGTEYAPEILQWSKMLGIDPRQVEHVVEGQFGYFGRLAIDASEAKTPGDWTQFSMRMSGIGMNGSGFANRDVLGASELLKSYGMRPKVWSDVRSSVFDAKTMTERRDRERAMIEMAQKIRDVKLTGTYLQRKNQLRRAFGMSPVQE